MRRLLLLPLLCLACTGDDDDGSGPDSGMRVDTGPQACETWVVEYDLSMGTQFDIRNTPFGRGDATNDIGPGSLKLRFDDDMDELATGPVTMIDYQLKMDFTVADVHTDIDVSAGPDECGVANGDYDGTAITWSTPIRGYRSQGTITCNAGEVVCAFANLPDGEPSPRDDTDDQALMNFTFSSSTSTVIPMNGFVMEYVEVPNDDAGDTFLRLTGRETRRDCVPAPSCP